MFKTVGTYPIKINEKNTAMVDVMKKSTIHYRCFFNKEEHKDFINGLGIKGFDVKIKNSGDEVELFKPISIRDSHSLTDELMKNVWHQIKEKKSEIEKGINSPFY